MYVYAQTYVVHVRTAHEYARTRTLQCQYGWTKSTNIKTFKCDGDLVLCLTRSPESYPNARGRVRGIALLCVQMSGNELRCNRTKLLINFDFAEQYCYAILKK